jgi:energy-coupling factor transporter ATP-binding protein EcfA2
MQFTLDLDVGAFLALHARARGVPEEVVSRVIDAACTLCGESFGPATHLSALSGGQSRALMIADTAVLAAAPVVLVDEVENAGVDRRRARDPSSSGSRARPSCSPRASGRLAARFSRREPREDSLRASS